MDRAVMEGMARLKEVSARERDRAFAFCEHRPECIFVAGWIQDGGLGGDPRVPKAWLFSEQDGSGAFVGLLYVSAAGIVIPHFHSRSAIDGLIALARANPNMIRVLVGERLVVSEIWERLTRIGFSARMIRNQRALTTDRHEFRPDPDSFELVSATQRDLDDIVSASAAMAREEAQDDPQARNPELFRKRIQERIGRGRDFIFRAEKQLVFKCNVSAISPIGGQIEGIYTVPSVRRMGYGKKGTSWVTTWVLSRAERALLLVNDDNFAADRLYRSLGYSTRYDSQTIFIKA